MPLVRPEDYPPQVMSPTIKGAAVSGTRLHERSQSSGLSSPRLKLPPLGSVAEFEIDAHLASKMPVSAFVTLSGALLYANARSERRFSEVLL